MVTMANYSQPEAASAPLATTTSAQIIPHTIKLNPPLICKAKTDYEIIESWIYNVDNYFTQTGLTDPSE